MNSLAVRDADSQRATAPLYDQLVRLLPERLTSTVKSPTIAFFVRALAVLVAFVVIDRLLGRAAQLSGESYRQTILALEVPHQLGWLLMVALVTAAALLFFFGALRSGWGDIQHGSQYRLFVLFLCVIIAWPFVTHGYNYYFAQGYGFDRLLILLMLPLIGWRPAFVFVFLFLLYAMMGQLVEPSLGGTILAHKLQVTRAIGLFAAAFLIHAISGERRSDHYLFLTCCFVAAAYWLPALAKLRIGWLTSDHLYTVPMSAYAHGWLGFLTPEQIVTLSQSLTWIDPVMRAAVIVAEAGCLFFLWNRRVSITLLTCVIVFHFGVFAMMGFFFWTWIALDAALLLLLIRGVRENCAEIHRGAVLAVSVVLILSASWWAKPPLLGWYDTPLSYTFEVHAITDDDEQHRLHPRFFAPYEDVFTMASFAYLVEDHAQLVGPYGVTHNAQINQQLDDAESAAEIFALEAARDTRYNEQRTERFRNFLRTFVQQRNADGDRGLGIYALHSPLQFWSQIEGMRTLGERQIKELIVTEVTSFFDGQRFATIRRHETLHIAIAAPD